MKVAYLQQAYQCTVCSSVLTIGPTQTYKIPDKVQAWHPEYTAFPCPYSGKVFWVPVTFIELEEADS